MKIIRLIQGSEEWHRHRALYRNASETAAVMGLSPWMTRYQLWEIKTGRRCQDVTYPMQRGIDLEPIARKAFEEAIGAIMEPVVVLDGDYSASLDGLTYDGELLLEIKCPMKGRDSDTWRFAETGLVERHYEVQIQHQLMVSGATQAVLWVFDGKEGIQVEVEPNKDAFHDIRAAWDEFWKLVASDTPPPITERDTVSREDEAWREVALAFIAARNSAEVAARGAEEAKAKLVALTRHTSEQGHGVRVCRYWKGRKNSQEEVRVTVLKQGSEPC